MKDLQNQLDAIWTKLQVQLKPIFKHHVFIVTILILAAMIVVVLRINQQLQAPSDDDYRTQKESEAIHTSFDQTTIDRIKELCRGSQGCSVNFGDERKRFSPFVE